MKQILPTVEACAPLTHQPMSAEDADRLAAAIKVIANPARLQLLSLIHAQPDHEACVCNLVEPLALSQSTVSHHLKVLLDAGLLEREQRGTWAFYRTVPNGLGPLLDLLA